MNELLLLGEAVVSTFFVLGAWRYVRERLYGVIVIFLILIANMGGKLIDVFGHTTNTGNIFYASVFLATYFIIERLGKREGMYSIWVGVIGVAFFFVFVQFTVSMIGSPTTAVLNNALAVAYTPFSQVTTASILAYVISQNFNVFFYAYLKKNLNHGHLWLRVNISNFLSQIIDSAIFFTIAFWGVIAPDNITDILMTGFVIKILFVAITSPLLYLNRIESYDEKDAAVIALR